MGQHAHGVGAKAGGDVGGELVVPAAGHLGFHRHAFDGVDAGDGFGEEGGVFCAAIEFFVQAGAQYRGDGEGDEQVHRQGGQYHQGEPDAVIEHHGDEDHGEEQVQHQGEGVAGEELADVFQLAHAGDGIAGAAGAEVGEGEGEQVAVEPRAQFHVDAAGGVGEDVGAQAGQAHLEQRGGDEADGDDVQGGEAAMHQHLVHDHLEEQGRDQGQELQDEGDQEHFAQQAAVFDDGGDDPGEVGLGHLGGQGGAGGDEDEFAAPVLRQFFLGKGAGVAVAGLLDQRALFRVTGQDEGAAFMVQGQGGERGAVQLFLPGAQAAGLEAQLASGEEGFIHAEGRAEFVGQLGRVHRHPVIAGQHDQSGQEGAVFCGGTWDCIRRAGERGGLCGGHLSSSIAFY